MTQKKFCKSPTCHFFPVISNFQNFFIKIKWSTTLLLSFNSQNRKLKSVKQLVSGSWLMRYNWYFTDCFLDFTVKMYIFQAPINDDKASTLMIGMTPSTTKAHMTRAILESIAFRFKLLYETVLDETKIPLSYIRY